MVTIAGPETEVSALSPALEVTARDTQQAILFMAFCWREL